MTKEELASALDAWFRESATNDRRWRRDPVGIVLKRELKALKQWKSKPRGNPAKGKERQLYGKGEA